MRGYLDIQNQQINPTLKRKVRAARTCSPGQRDCKENPSSTLKFDAYVGQRRKYMETKKGNEELKFQEEVERFIKQNRLAQRVKCSPAIVNNSATLKMRKADSIRRSRENNKRLEQNWEQQKQMIEFNVANKPLLVEQGNPILAFSQSFSVPSFHPQPELDPRAAALCQHPERSQPEPRRAPD